MTTLNGFQVMDATGFLLPENDLLSMDFGAYGPATVAGTNVSVNVPFSTDVTALAPTFTLSPYTTCSPDSGTGAPFTATGLSGSTNGMKGWLSGQLGYSFTNAAYAELIDQAYVGGAPVMSIGGLTIGHEYRLQIILQDTRGTPAVEGVNGPALTPGNPGLVTATWVAKDDTLNVSWSGGASPHFSGYALHDMGGAVPPYDTWGNGTFANAFTDKDPTHDPDGDGLSNFQEFAFGLDPTTGASVNPITVPLSGTQFRYAKWADSGLTYKVYYSTNLSAWTWDEFAVQSAAAPDGSGVSVVTVTLAAAAPDAGKLFVRVEAQ